MADMHVVRNLWRDRFIMEAFAGHPLSGLWCYLARKAEHERQHDRLSFLLPVYR